MTVYSAFMFAVAVLLWLIGNAIYRGKTELIHDYHQNNVTEENREAYGREFAGGLYVLGGSMLTSGILDVFLTESMGPGYSIAVLVMGIILSLSMLLKTQKKYNGGLF